MKQLIACLLGLLLAPAWSFDLRDGDVAIYRHALAPGGGDPSALRLGDCSTQRNLSDAGREQARRLGEMLRQRLGELQIAEVWASPWCRALDTARLAFPGMTVREQPAFGSFFQHPEREAQMLGAARQLLVGWRGPGVLVVVTHQVTITGLSSVFPASGEGIAMRWSHGDGKVLGRLPAPAH
ncbi:MAG: histidine phosphatase family protein [Roseateles sp.]|uniref:histidine phosphatase family protein n=1 Tax=Roseateles sp. TaxID=1971397 RepID=UPI004036A85E